MAFKTTGFQKEAGYASKAYDLRARPTFKLLARECRGPPQNSRSAHHRATRGDGDEPH